MTAPDPRIEAIDRISPNEDFTPGLSQMLPPQNLEAEELILGGILGEGGRSGQNFAYERVKDILTCHCFYDTNHRHIYRAIEQLAAKGDIPDLMTVTSQLMDKGKLDTIGGTARLAQLAERAVSTVNIDRHAELVKEKYLRRDMIALSYEMAQRAYTQSIPLERAHLYSKARLEELAIQLSDEDPDNARCDRLVAQTRELLLDPKLSPQHRKYKLSKLSKSSGYSIGELKDFYHSSLIEDDEEPMTLAQLREKYGSEYNDWVLPGWLARGSTTLVHAEGGTGKTLWAYDLAYSISNGLDWSGFPVLKKQKVLIIQKDEPVPTMLSNLDLRGFNFDSPNLMVKTKWNVEYLPRLYELCKTWKPDLVLIDSLQAINANQCISENEQDYARPVLMMADIAQECGCHLMLIHHSSHQGKSRGSTAIPAAVSQVIKVERMNDDPDDVERKLIVTKSRSGGCIGSHLITLDPENKSWTYEGRLKGRVLVDDPDAPAKERVIDFLKQRQGVAHKPSDIRDQLLIALSTARNLMKELYDRRIIQRAKLKGRGYVYWLGDRPKDLDDCNEKLSQQLISSSSAVPSAVQEPDNHAGLDPNCSTAEQNAEKETPSESVSKTEKTSAVQQLGPNPSQGEDLPTAEPTAEQLLNPQNVSAVCESGDNPQHSATIIEGELYHWRDPLNMLYLVDPPFPMPIVQVSKIDEEGAHCLGDEWDNLRVIPLEELEEIK
ncbi:MAG: DnaB-like helicase N-terminal domain-containing protein [Cyanobacteria bacterium P01_G01_bin.54]